jgi:Zn-dependent protease
MMETTPLTPIQEAFCALAGPMGSFLVLLMSEVLPEAALCGLFQGAYNLLPIYPLDGGRISLCVLPKPLYRSLEAMALTFFTGFSLWLMTIAKELALIFLFSLWIPVFRRKSSCKESILAVQ